MFCLLATSLGQEGFPTLFRSNLSFQEVSFSGTVPDWGEQVHFGAGVSLKHQTGEKLLLWACAGESHRVQVWYRSADPPRLDWCWVSLQNSPLPLPFLLSCLQRTTVFYLFLCLALSASPFLSSHSPLSYTFSVLLIQCVLPLHSSSNIAATTLHCQHSWFLTLLDHWAMLWAQPLQQTWQINSMPELFFSLLCYRKGCFGHEDLRLASCALPEET